MILALLNVSYFVLSIVLIFTLREYAAPFILHSFVLLLSMIFMLCSRHKNVLRKSKDGHCAAVTYFVLMLISYIILLVLGIGMPTIVYIGATMSRSDSNC